MTARVVAGAFVAVAVVIPLGACKSQGIAPVPTPAASAPPVSSSLAAPTAGSNPSASPSASVTRAGHAPRPVPAGTPHAPGVVACGTGGRCEREEACCGPNPSHVVADAPTTATCFHIPPGADPTVVCSWGPIFTCDDSVDCPAGTRCEEMDYADGDFTMRLCTKDANIAREPCRRGGACRTPGTSCELTGDVGTCELPKPAVTLRCGGGVCKPGEGCCHDGHLHRDYCVDDDKKCSVAMDDFSNPPKGRAPSQLVYCTSRRECRANERCFYTPAGTSCARSGQFIEACERAEDCRPADGALPCKKLVCLDRKCDCPGG